MMLQGHGWGLLVGVTLAAFGAGAEQIPARHVVIHKVMVDGRPHAPPPRDTLRLPRGARRLAFDVGPLPAARVESLRLQYKLEGFDTEWRELDNGLRMAVRFCNAEGEILEGPEYMATGRSEGWEGTPQRSRFVPRQEALVVPEQGVTFRFALGGGSPDTVGTYVADDFKIKRADSGEILFEEDVEHGDRLDTPRGMPPGWRKYGSSHNILQVISFPGEHRTNHALAVFDDKTGFSGVWSMSVPLAGRARRGDVLLMEWREMFSSGWGGRAVVGYEYVPPGRYVFRLRAVTPLGERPRGEVALTVVNPTPLWQTGWFLLALAATGAAAIAWIVRAIVRFRWKRRVERLEWQQAVGRERARIARDMHDDVGAHLTRIGLLSQTIRNEAPAGSAVSDAAESMDTAVRATTQAMSELVWAVNPRYDTLDGLANYFGRYAQELLSMAGLRCRLDLPAELPDLALAASARHQLFLAFKEALNNSVRHAGAREVCVALTISAERFVLSVTDDGHGFDPERVTAGHGLRNMAARLGELGGSCEVISRPGGGTSVRLRMPVRGPVRPPAGAVTKDGEP